MKNDGASPGKPTIKELEKLVDHHLSNVVDALLREVNYGGDRATGYGAAIEFGLALGHYHAAVALTVWLRDTDGIPSLNVIRGWVEEAHAQGARAAVWP